MTVTTITTSNAVAHSWRLRLAFASWFLFAGIMALRAPLPSPTSTSFSVDRALQSLQWIANEPHPVGTLAHDGVSDRIQAEVQRLGLQVEVQNAMYLQSLADNRTRLVRIRNVIAKRHGSSDLTPVVLMAHYDSVSSGPGAGDDGVGVATLLETARLIAAGPPLRNDIIFVFTDAEELGLCGSSMFVAEHPWARKIGALINFEARGVRGPAMLFETGPKTGWLIREFLDSAPAPDASSLIPSLFRYTRYATDLNSFRQTEVPRLNFAFADGWQAYHTWRDKLDSVEPVTIRDEGSYAVALANRLGNLDLTNQPKRSREIIYFNLGPLNVRYDARFAPFIAFLAILGWVWFFGSRWRSGKIRIWQVASGGLGILFAVLAASGAAWATWQLLQRLVPDRKLLSDRFGLIATGLIMLTAFVILVTAEVLKKFTTIDGVVLGTLAWFVVLSAYTAISTPGISYIFAWSLAGATLLAYGAIDMKPLGSGGNRQALAVLVGSACLLCILLPAARFVFIAIPALPFIGVPVAALGIALMIPGVELIAPGIPWRMSGALFACSAVLTILCVVPGSRSNLPEHRATGAYIASPGLGVAAWLSSDRLDLPSGLSSATMDRDKLTRYVPAWYELANKNGPYLVEAPLLRDLAWPTMTLESETTQGGTRVLALRVLSRRMAPELRVCLRSTRGISDLSVEGHNIPQTPSQNGALPKDNRCDRLIEYFGSVSKGLSMTVKIPANAQLTVDVVDTTFNQTGTQRPDELVIQSKNGEIPASLSLKTQTAL
jgi:hypothetical protein